MLNRKAIENRMADRALARLGCDVWLRGVKFTGHLLDGEYPDDSGIRRELSIGIKPEDAKHFKREDVVIVHDAEYKIRRIPEYTHQELLVNIEVLLVKA